MNVMQKLRKGQTMVEYILIVGLIAISLVALIGFFTRGVGRKIAGATEAISETEGNSAKNAVNNLNSDNIKQLGEN